MGGGGGEIRDLLQDVTPAADGQQIGPDCFSLDTL